MQKIIKNIRSPFFGISLLYFITRLINLLTLPIFNDEAIYIDWGFKEINTKGLLFYSLYDGKPPLLMWVFGLFEKILNDPLLAGRVVSVLTGFLTLAGLYKLARRYFDAETSYFSAIFYVLIPIFTFFDRQALMESALCSVGIWSLYYFLELKRRSTNSDTIILGLILGIGIFVKQTGWIFILVLLLISFLMLLRKRKTTFFKKFLLSLLISQIVLIPLYSQDNFWLTFSSNNRFALSLQELLSFPINIWIKNLTLTMSIFYGYFFAFLTAAIMYGLFQKQESSQKIIMTFFLLALIIPIFTFRVISPRYLVAFLPISTVFAANCFVKIGAKSKKFKFLAVSFSAVIPMLLTVLLIGNPSTYFYLLSHLTDQSQKEDYISNWTGGYATTQAIKYLKEIVKDKQAFVGVRLDAGNPESAVFAYFENTSNISPLYFDIRTFGQGILDYSCLSSVSPFYFVSRDNSTAGMDKFLVQIKMFKQPEGNRFIAIYTLNKNCNGKNLLIKFNSE